MNKYKNNIRNGSFSFFMLMISTVIVLAAISGYGGISIITAHKAFAAQASSDMTSSCCYTFYKSGGGATSSNPLLH